MNGFSSSSSNKEKKYVLEGVVLEMELRTSEFTFLNSRSQLESVLIHVSLVKDNLLDLLLTRDISDNAHFSLSLVS